MKKPVTKKHILQNVTNIKCPGYTLQIKKKKRKKIETESRIVVASRCRTGGKREWVMTGNWYKISF